MNIKILHSQIENTVNTINYNWSGDLGENTVTIGHRDGGVAFGGAVTEQEILDIVNQYTDSDAFGIFQKIEREIKTLIVAKYFFPHFKAIAIARGNKPGSAWYTIKTQYGYEIASQMPR